VPIRFLAVFCESTSLDQHALDYPWLLPCPAPLPQAEHAARLVARGVGLISPQAPAFRKGHHSPAHFTAEGIQELVQQVRGHVPVVLLWHVVCGMSYVGSEGLGSRCSECTCVQRQTICAEVVVVMVPRPTFACAGDVECLVQADSAGDCVSDAALRSTAAPLPARSRRDRACYSDEAGRSSSNRAYVGRVDRAQKCRRSCDSEPNGSWARGDRTWGALKRCSLGELVCGKSLLGGVLAVDGAIFWVCGCLAGGCGVVWHNQLNITQEERWPL
jgi:hypothetical protein